MLEYIPWLRECFEEPATVEEGLLSDSAKSWRGNDLAADATEKFGVE